jgi:5-methylcytosine-specific restriction enzyme A
MGWAGSNRLQRLPIDWAARRELVLDRDPICMKCGRAPSVDVDHINPGGLCRSCHKAKSSAEGHAARYRNPRRRPTEPHPGAA